MANKVPFLTGSFASESRRRDDRYTSRYTIYIMRGHHGKPARIATNKVFDIESEAMKAMNAAFTNDETITNGFILEAKTTRTYHRHEYTDDNLCVHCWGRRK